MFMPNKLMTWEEMVEAYPSRWVIVEKTRGDADTIEEGFVRYVVIDEEIPKIWIKCREAELNYNKDRTTVAPFTGIADGVTFDISIEEIFGNEDQLNFLYSAFFIVMRRVMVIVDELSSQIKESESDFCVSLGTAVVL